MKYQRLLQSWVLVTGVLVTLVCATVYGAGRPGQQDDSQSQQPGEQKRPTLGKPAPDENQQRPTLRKGDEPEEQGPRTSTTTNPRRLLTIHRIYFDPIDNSLSDKLADIISHMGRFQIVAERKQADAVVSGTCFDSRRLKTVHSEVFIHDQLNNTSIWQDVVRRHYNPPPLSKVVEDTANIIVAHLAESVQEAQQQR